MQIVELRNLALALLIFFITSSANAQTRAGPDDRFKISLTVNGAAWQGRQELLIAGATGNKSDAELHAMFDATVQTVQRGASFQLLVTVTMPNGTSSNYTSSARLQYEHFGCLTASKAGFVTVTPSGQRCAGPDIPALWIVLLDEKGEAITYNSYLMRVQP